MSPALTLLKSKFGYDSFRHNQEEIIQTVLNKQDVFVLMPTGGGKSVCYQIPALIFNGLTVVVSPLIALMKDQVDALRVNGIHAAYLNSSLEPEEREEVFNDLRLNKLKLIYIAPERLFNNEQQFIDFLKTLPVCLFAIDEAHCISSWGHDFRPEYRLLSELKQEFPLVPTIALTATADAVTRQDIVAKLQLRDPKQFIASFNRPNIHYTIEPKRNMYDRLTEYLRGHRDDAGIIYTLSRKSAENLADDLNHDGFSAKPYHAGLDQDKRGKHQDLFQRDKIKIIVATIAFGMGINKSNVRFVIHADLPKNIESYYQETGRAGRDGLPSEALLFFSGGDVIKLKNFATIDGNPEQTRILLNKLSQMADLCEARSCRRQKMLAYFGEQFPDNCASCDVCETSYEHFDGTTIAQKALSAVARLNQNFGLTYVVDFLRGSKSEKIKEHHKTLPTYGIGADIPKDAWFVYLKDLIAKGFLEQSGAEYPVLKLTQKSVGVLNGKETVMLIKPIVKPATGVGAIHELPLREGGPHEYEKKLFATLKTIRMEIANLENVPAFIIFSDATLLELATYLPLTLEDVRKISGFGDVKIARYGQKFLSAVTSYCRAHNLSSKISEKIPKRERLSSRGEPEAIPRLGGVGVGELSRTRFSSPSQRRRRGERSRDSVSDTKLESLRLFQSGKNISHIANIRELSPGTISNHLAHFIPSGEVKIEQLVTAEKIPVITEAINRQRRAGLYNDYATAPIKTDLGDNVSYEEIRAVLQYLRK